MNRCAAAWIELNMSGPDNRVTACCYYAGETDEWGDPAKTMEDYWNSPKMRYLRRLQIDPTPPKNHGCSTCHLYENQAPGYDRYDFSAEVPPDGLSPRQLENWLLGKQEFLAGAEVLLSRPARVYANFGFACNISCTMCHQVPRRLDNRRTMSADQLLSWGDDIERARQMIVIGGEPFTLPEAIKFIRGFIAEENRYEAVQLAITTNATVLHKHWNVLHQKKRLAVCVSLDGIGEAFESVRLGAKWADVERNTLKLLEARATDRPEWEISTASLIQKSTLRNLPEFAQWHARHGLETVFSDFISAPGVEDTFFRENFLHNSHLLDDVPEWRDYFDDAIQTFDAAGLVAGTASLAHFKERVEQAVAAARRSKESRVRRMRNDWVRVGLPSEGEQVERSDWTSSLTAVAASGRGEVPLGTRQEVRAFLRTRLGDALVTPFIGVRSANEGGEFRIRLHWSRFEAADEVTRRAHVKVERHDGAELEAFRELVEFGVGSDIILTGAINSDVEAIRVVLTPVGEEISLLPKLIEVDLDPSTARRPWPRPEEVVPPGRFKLSSLLRFVGKPRRSQGPAAKL